MKNKSDTLQKSITSYSRRLSSLTLITAAAVTASVILAATVNILFCWGLTAGALLLACMYYFSRKRKTLKILLAIQQEWGLDYITKERDIKAVRTLFDHGFSRDGADIDDQTWRDLNMDLLYTRIDRAYTDPGEAVLYKILREPLADKEKLAARDRVIRFFQNDTEAREKIQYTLACLGHQYVHNDLFNLLWRDNYSKSKAGPLFTLLALAALVSLILPFIFWSAYLVPIPVVLFLINLAIHFSNKNRKDVETVSFPYLINCIKFSKVLSQNKSEEISVYTNKLKETHKASTKILKKARFLFTSTSAYNDPSVNFFLEYLNIFFLLEVRSFYGTIDSISKNSVPLREMYLTIGELDALQAVASYRESLPVYTVPYFIEEGIHLELKDARQPLLENPVPASISFKNNTAVITGSNMGGKSTFLRNIGNNVLLAQTIATAAASYYRGSFFYIMTSISRTDDLIAGKSFYFVEAERILKALLSISTKLPTLCIIDEMLSGTNSNERLAASEAIVRYLTGQNALSIIATHDLELAGKLKDICAFYHFTDSVDENGLKFDYLLKPGLATTQNAVRLLKYLGYPREITDRADQSG